MLISIISYKNYSLFAVSRSGGRRPRRRPRRRLRSPSQQRRPARSLKKDLRQKTSAPMNISS